jgi:hypothetical protein
MLAMTERDTTLDAMRREAPMPVALASPLHALPSLSEPPVRPQEARPTSRPRPVVDEYDDSMWEEGLASW